MRNVTFPIYKEETDGSMILDKTIDVSRLTATKDGSPFSTTFTNIGDGTYKFTTAECGEYSGLLDGQVQSEFDDVYISADDNLTEENLKSSPTKGYIIDDGSGDLKLKDGETVLLEADIVNDLTTGGTTEPLSAEQGKTLKTAVDGKEATDATILKEADINSDIATGGAAKVVSADELKDQLDPAFASPTYISNTNTAVQNLDALDQAVASVSGSGGNKVFKMLHSTPDIAGTATGNTITGPTYIEFRETSTSYVEKLRIPFRKDTPARGLSITFEMVHFNFQLGEGAGGATLSVKLTIEQDDGTTIATSEAAGYSPGYKAMELSIPSGYTGEVLFVQVECKIDGASAATCEIHGSEIYLTT